MTQTIIWTIAILTILGAALAVVLYIVAEKFKVEEDPRIDDVEKELPGANCGGCGQAGCRAFAQFCVESEDLDKCFCPVGGNDVMQKVAAVLGREVAAKEPMVAVVRCNGSCENRPKTNEYGGYQPLISIVVPTYETKEKFLRELLDCVIRQTYSNWELCLADGSDNEHNKVGKICNQFVKSDKRVT